MRNRMAVSRCCCDGVVVVNPEPQAAWLTDWSDIENGTGTVVDLISVFTDPEIRLAPVGLTNESLGWTWPFNVGDIPLSLATAVMRFTGFRTEAGGGPTEADQTIGIYAAKWNGGADPDISDLFGPVLWSQPGADPWGAPPGTVRVTDDLATIINDLTSSVGWNHGTDSVMLLLRAMTWQTPLQPIRQLDNSGPIQVAQLEYTV